VFTGIESRFLLESSTRCQEHWAWGGIMQRIMATGAGWAEFFKDDMVPVLDC
jgi:hypothetical protein